MYHTHFQIYEGTKPYIFISYAHKDSDTVLPILDELHKRGYRVWYDAGIAPGSEWPEYIAEHLNGSGVTMAFISSNSIASANCRREVTFALSKKKPFLGVLLCATEMSLGMEMQLSAHQCVVRDKFETEEDFLNNLCSMSELAPCLMTQKELAAEAAAEEAANPPKKYNTNAPQIDADDMHTVAAMHAATADKSKGQGPSVYSTELSRKPIPKALIAGAAAVAAVIIGIAAIAGGKAGKSSNTASASNAAQVSDSTNQSGDDDGDQAVGSGEESKPEIEYKAFEIKDKSANYMCFEQMVVDDAALKQLAKCKSVSYIVFKNCKIEGDLSSLSQVEKLTKLELDSCDMIYFTFLNDLSGLQLLSLKNVDLDNSSAELLGYFTNLYSLDISDNPEVTSLDSFALPTLQYLNISGTGISSIDCLCGLEKLKMLKAADTKITEVGSVFMSLKLEELDLSGCDISDVSAFENLTVLKSLRLNGTKVTDAAWAAKSAATLKEFRASGCALTQDTLTGLASCTLMEKLHLDGNPMKDLSIVADMANLQVLRVDGCGIENADALTGKTALTGLWLQNNAISSIDVSAAEKLKAINIGNNQITSLAKLPITSTLGSVLCYGCPVDVMSIPELGSKYTAIVMDYTDAVLEKENWKGSVLYLALLDTPLDKKVAVESGLSGVKTYFISSEDIPSAIEATDSIVFADLMNYMGL